MTSLVWADLGPRSSPERRRPVEAALRLRLSPARPQVGDDVTAGGGAWSRHPRTPGVTELQLPTKHGRNVLTGVNEASTASPPRHLSKNGQTQAEPAGSTVTVHQI